ncbi:MAG: flagellar M-ring protein FliF [Candidatus Hydrogenedentes bacterium]|nr:flagellar M-ring protein FliF [Candidatus Hydrogenedentota bacterium]
MLQFIRQFLAGLVLAWERLSASARVTVAVAFIFTVAIIAAMVTLGSRPQYVDLYTGLSQADMLAVQGRLEQESVPYKMEPVSGTIKVPLQNRSDMMVKIGGAGLVKSQGSTPGFEIFDSANLMSTEFTNKVNLIRAKSGELQQLLGRFDFVRNAYVSIAESEEKLFEKNQLPVEANVTLEVSQPLNEGQVKAVLNTVSASIAGLSKDHINLATTDGKVLHAPADSDFDSIASSKFDLARAYRNERKREAEDALKALGIRSVITVMLDVDHTTKKETKELYEKGVAVSNYKIKTSTTSSESAPQGPAGARANLPGDAQSAGGQQNEQTETQQLTNTEPSVTRTTTESGPGDVTVTGATAIVEGKYEDEVDAQGAATGKKVYKARDKKELETYQSLVASAVGISDISKVKISDHPFELQQLATATPGVAAATPTAFSFGALQLDGILKIVAVALLFFVVRFLALRATVRKERAEESVEIELPKASPDELRKREIATEVERVSQEQPEAVASLLRTWLSETEE